MNVILFGFKNVGKSTIGKRLAEKLSYAFIDTDSMIENVYAAKHTEKKSCAEIFDEHGEAYFRGLERDVIFSLSSAHDSVIAIGGGGVLDSTSVKALKEVGPLIYLKAPKVVLKKRFFSHPPIYADKQNLDESFEDLFEKRSPIYQKIADYELILSDDPGANADLIYDIVRTRG